MHAAAARAVRARLGLNVLVRTAWSRRLFGLPAPPASLVTAAPEGRAGRQAYAAS